MTATDPTPNHDERKTDDRREVLKKMGTIAAYTAPVLLGTMVPTKAARASGSPEGGSWGGGGLGGGGGGKGGNEGGLWDLPR